MNIEDQLQADWSVGPISNQPVTNKGLITKAGEVAPPLAVRGDTALC